MGFPVTIDSTKSDLHVFDHYKLIRVFLHLSDYWSYSNFWMSVRFVNILILYIYAVIILVLHDFQMQL